MKEAYADTRADIYNCGLICYKLLTGSFIRNFCDTPGSGCGTVFTALTKDFGCKDEKCKQNKEFLRHIMWDRPGMDLERNKNLTENCKMLI